MRHIQLLPPYNHGQKRVISHSPRTALIWNAFFLACLTLAGCAPETQHEPPHEQRQELRQEKAVRPPVPKPDTASPMNDVPDLGTPGISVGKVTPPPDPQPMKPALAPSAFDSRKNSFGAWEAGLCAGKLPMSWIQALQEDVFTSFPIMDSIARDCDFDRYAMNSRFQEKIATYVEKNRGLKRGMKRFIWGLLIDHEANSENSRSRADGIFTETDDDGLGFLHRVVARDDQNLMRELLQFDEQTEVDLIHRLTWPDRMGRLPLHYVRSSGMLALLWPATELDQWARQFGKEPVHASALDNSHMTPVSVMAQAGFGPAVQSAVSRLCPQPTDWVAGVSIGLLYKVEYKLAHHVLNLPDDRGRTPLMLAVLGDHPVAVDAIASCPAVDFSVADNVTGWTALHYAASRPGFLSGLQILHRGARGIHDTYQVNGVTHLDINTRDRKGNTALHIAYRCHNHQAIAILTNKKYGADLTLTDQSGYVAGQAESVDLGCPEVK